MAWHLALLLLVPWHESQGKVTGAHAAVRFVAALNAGDVAKMMAASASPFLYRNQKWKTADGGSGFVLGAAEDQRRKTARQRRELFEHLAKTTKIQSPQPAERPPAQKVLLQEQLKGADTGWSQLELFVFLRGFGDVEHIALVGVDRKGKVKALYLN
ncbi:MAG TPA: hypothetical protein VM120_08785 [Bryobacteraceae bacterium]|nr:hypothetical protein [Bryobacteraceae bacterium]